MMSQLLIALAVFVGVSALVAAVAMLLRPAQSNRMENRLELLAGTGTAASKEALKQSSVLAQPLDKMPNLFDRLFERFGNINLLFEQADTSLTITKLVLITAGLALLGILLAVAAGIHPVLVPLVSVLLGSLPLVWLLYRRRRRLKAFAAQLPEALEMLARSLRAGQSIGFGFNMIANEMPPPISKEFGRVFEEQNLGIPLEESLSDLTNRVPNLDLKFFATALVLQRQTGGDLAEILDKIGSLIRDRFRIWGQVQALTGEGRLSGIVLLALPVVLFLVVYQLNPGYVMVLFTDPLGKKMLVAAIIMQILGALVIRKIVNIKV